MPSPIGVPLNVQFPWLNGGVRRTDSFRPSRINESPYRSMQDAGRNSTVPFSYLRRELHGPRNERGQLPLNYVAAMSRVVQALANAVDGLELLPTEHALLLRVLPDGFSVSGRQFRMPAVNDVQAKELMQDMSDDEASQLRQLVMARLPELVSLATVTTPAQPVVLRKALDGTDAARLAALMGALGGGTR